MFFSILKLSSLKVPHLLLYKGYKKECKIWAFTVVFNALQNIFSAILKLTVKFDFAWPITRQTFCFLYSPLQKR